MNQHQTSVQKDVLAALSQRAQRASDDARSRLERWLVSEAGLTQSDIDLLRRHVASSEITVTFPAEKVIAPQKGALTGGATLLIDALMTETALLNYWVTGATGGQAPDGGRQRNAVEVVLLRYPDFAQDLAPDSGEATDRPRFGAVNQYKQTVSSRAEGAEGYGSVSLVLKPQLLRYATLTSADTNEVAGPKCQHILDLIRAAKQQAGPSGDWTQESAGKQAEQERHLLPPVGSFNAFDHVILGFDATQGHASSWRDWIETLLKVARGVPQPGAGKYWEAQIHAQIAFKTDVAIVRASYRKLFGTDVGTKVQDWARLNQLPLVWGHEQHVVCDPTVRLAMDATVADEDLKYWRYLRVKTSQSVQAAAEHFNDQWRKVAEHRGPAQPQGRAELLPRDTARTHWVALWAAMPSALRVNPMPAVADAAADMGWLTLLQRPSSSAS